PFCLDLHRFVDLRRQFLVLVSAGGACVVDIQLDLEDLFIGETSGGGCFLRRLPFGLRLPFIALSRATEPSGRDERDEQGNAQSDRQSHPKNGLLPHGAERPSQGQREQERQDRPARPSLSPGIVSEHCSPQIVWSDGEYRRGGGGRGLARRGVNCCPISR